MAITEYRFWGDAPRFTGMSAFIKRLAWELRLGLEIHVDKGWFSEQFYGSVRGEENSIKRFEATLKQISHNL